MGKTKELSKDIRDTIVDLHKAGMGYKKISNLVRSYLLEQLLENGRNTKSLPISSVWGSMQELASWDINDDEKGQGSAQYYTGGAC